MSFRRNRGAKMKRLIEEEENMEELDDFWLGNTYFGCKFIIFSFILFI